MSSTTFVDYTTPAISAAWLNAVNNHVYADPEGRVSIFKYIPENLWAGIIDGTNTTDLQDYFDLALAAEKHIWLPAGSYYIKKPLNMTSRNTSSGAYDGRTIEGAGSNICVLNIYPGEYPCIDLTGSSNCTLKGFNIRSDNGSFAAGLSSADLSSIGILNQRGDSGGQSTSGSFNRIQDVRINLYPLQTRNGANGTMGIVNIGGEHLIFDNCQIYASIPLVMQNSAKFTITQSSSNGTYGSEFEKPYSGSPISCTMFDFRSLQLISYDSFRSIWFDQVANISLINLYTSSRYLADTTPQHNESFLFVDVLNLNMQCYQEVSGLFGATYLMDHRYITIGGVNGAWDIKIQRGVGDYGYANPGVAQPSLYLLNGAYIANSEIDANYTIGMYNASGDNLGLAANPITFAGTPNAIVNTTFVLDRSGGHSASIFATLAPYCTNVESINYLSGDRYYGFNTGTFTPTVIGGTTAGVGTYSTRAGIYSKSGRSVTFSIILVWSGHTGTGDMIITGLPFTGDANVEHALSVDFSNLVVGSGKQFSAVLQNNGSSIGLNACDPAGGSRTAVSIDTAVSRLLISGTIKIKD